MNTFKSDEDTKNTLLEISALSGYSQGVVKEVLEYWVYSWAIKIVDNPDSYASLVIPYLGSVSAKYKNDKITSSGEIATEVDTFVDLSDSFKKLIGDLHDEGYSALVPLMQKKIEQAIIVASSPE